MKTLFMPLLLALALLAGCAPSSSGTGGAQLAASLPQGLSASISRVSVTASAADFPPVSVDLAFSNGSWGGTLGNLPAGNNRTFLAQAFDASGTQRFEGSATGVSISAEQTTLVAITLQQLDAPPPFENEAPIIDSLTAPSPSVAVGSALSLVAAAHDPNPGDTLTYAWSATAGSFSSSSEASTAWTAASTPGFQTLTLTVTDSQGLASSLALTVYVAPGAMQGHAEFSISFNIAPRVTSLSAAPTRLEAGQSTSVSALASDVDGDSLSYSWSASCAGTWSNGSSRSAQFTPSAVPAGSCNNCRLTVTVSDGRGGQSTGTVSLCISLASTQHRNPVILSSSGSSGTATPSQVLTFEVEALDPESSALSFSWTANTGSLGSPVHTASSSHISWTAPSCVQAGVTAHITATVTNAFHVAVPQDFTVTGLPACGWASTGSMTSPRANHTATLLNTGKVLVTGGINNNGSILATAELYDPATGTWSPTGPMAWPRTSHTATLLINGKVLVAGGLGNSGYLAEVELYDPDAGTWSTTSPMGSRRMDHTATMLPHGKVLVAGGQNEEGIVAMVELYDPDAGTWSPTGALASPRVRPTATLLSNGKVLVAGGAVVDGYLDTVEVYEPASGTWSAAAPMVSAHAWHTATLLNNGQILVGGGIPLTQGELYTPSSGSWSDEGSAFPSRSAHTATLLPSGQVLVAGGYEFGLVATAKLYVP